MSVIKRVMKLAGYALAAGLLVLCTYFLSTHPSNDGAWQEQYAQLASFDIEDNRAVISNFRRARYDDAGDVASVTWESREVDLGALKDVWLGISVFGEPGLAHTFLSFDFGDGDPVVVSVEARQRPDQSYTPLQGLLDQYHLIFVMADEHDIVGLRTHLRKEEVYFQPLIISGARARALFLYFASRANRLAEQPEFYNTFTSNCTNGLLEKTDLPGWRRYLDPNIVLPANSDRVAYQYDILDTSHTLEELRAAARVDASSLKLDDVNFSTKIRAGFLERIREDTMQAPTVWSK